MSTPEILTTTVGSYPVPDWLAALPSEQAVIDATRVVFAIQRDAGIDLPTDGELYRFDINHPDTNGMIDYFVRPMSGMRTQVGRSDWEAYAKQRSMTFRAKPAAVVENALGEGGLNLLADCQRAARALGSLSTGTLGMGASSPHARVSPSSPHAQAPPFKFTVTSPYMLARTLLDRHYRNFEKLTLALAKVLAAQVRGLPCACVQIDEANIPGNPSDAPLAAKAINIVLDAVECQRAVHLCFGNYGGQTIQKGTWKTLVKFLNALHVDHLVLELAHRPAEDLDALKGVNPKIALGIGVVDIKVNHIETQDEIARRIERAETTLGTGRVKWVHPDCGFWMLKRTIADRKMAALVKGRDRFLGIEADRWRAGSGL